MKKICYMFLVSNADNIMIYQPVNQAEVVCQFAANSLPIRSPLIRPAETVCQSELESSSGNYYIKSVKYLYQLRKNTF